MYARIRRVKEGQTADADGHHDIVTSEMEKLSGTIQEFKFYGKYFLDWFVDLIATGYSLNWHKSWLNFNPRLTFKCPKCGRKLRIRVNLKDAKSLHTVKLKNPVQCKCGYVASVVNVEARELKN